MGAGGRRRGRSDPVEVPSRCIIIGLILAVAIYIFFSPLGIAAYTISLFSLCGGSVTLFRAYTARTAKNFLKFFEISSCVLVNAEL